MIVYTRTLRQPKFVSIHLYGNKYTRLYLHVLYVLVLNTELRTYRVAIIDESCFITATS